MAIYIIKRVKTNQEPLTNYRTLNLIEPIMGQVSSINRDNSGLDFFADSLLEWQPCPLCQQGGQTQSVPPGPISGHF